MVNTRTRRLSVTIAIAAVTATTINGLPAQATSGVVDPAAQPDVGAVFRDQAPLTAAREQILDLVATMPASGLAGTRVSVADRRLTVYWKGEVPSQLGDLVARLASPSARIRVLPAAHTREQLQAKATALIQLPGVWVVHQMPDGSGLEVGADLTGADNVREASTAVAPEIPVRITHVDPPDHPLDRAPAESARQTMTIPDGRLSDRTPHWGGARTDDGPGPNYSSWCTTGFPLRRTSDGRTFITTAAHCTGTVRNGVESFWAPDHESDTNDNYKFGDTWFTARGFDAKVIRSVVAGRIYDGGVRPGTEFSKPISRADFVGAGDSVCQSGSSSGAVCGITVHSEAIWKLTDGTLVSGWRADGSKQVKDVNGVTRIIGTCAGDSGGPVFALDWPDPGKVIALGMISAMHATGTFVWDNNHGERLTCNKTAFFVEIRSVITSTLGRGTVVTGV